MPDRLPELGRNVEGSGGNLPPLTGRGSEGFDWKTVARSIIVCAAIFVASDEALQSLASSYFQIDYHLVDTTNRLIADSVIAFNGAVLGLEGCTGIQ